MFELLPYGDRALLIECGSVHPGRLAAVLRLTEHWMDQPPLEIVPGASTVLVTSTTTPDLGRVREALRRAMGALESAESIDAGEVVVPVHYDGADLPEVASEVGRSVDEVIEAHTSALHTVDFCGFAPGFAYMSGLPAWLHVARLATPRTRVPAGSVAIAAGWSAVYPGESPGGWRLLGRTDVRVFDAARAVPALLSPGTRVRFTPA